MRLRKKYEELEKRVKELEEKGRLLEKRVSDFEEVLNKKQVSQRVEQEDRQLDIIKEYLLGKKE